MKKGSRRIRSYPTQKEIQSIFSYCPSSGRMCWGPNTKNRGRKKRGAEAGYLTVSKRRQVRLEGELYDVSVLAFIHYHGYKPKIVDHKDQDPSNNRIWNLRAANETINMFNSKQRASKLGVRGVWIHSTQSPRPFRAAIGYENKLIHLGCFATLAEAIIARKAGEIKYYGEEL